MPPRRAHLAVLLLALAGCVVRAGTPSAIPRDADGGRAPARFDPGAACGAWRAAVGAANDPAVEHDSFPELDPSRSCFVRVRYGIRSVEPDPIPAGCGYPDGGRAIAALRREADRARAIAEGRWDGPLPLELACALPAEVRAAAAAHNARTFAHLAESLPGKRYPYAAVATFGFGQASQGASALVGWRPGGACGEIVAHDREAFSVNLVRAERAAAAYAGGVAPVITVSGGAVHSPLYEAFLLEHLLTCRHRVPADAVLLDPCADHTHTNLRNTGSLVVALGGRTAFVVTDDGIQSGYLQEWTAFDLIGGSIDQRTLADFGYLLGSWRQASVGMNAGFWYTPYRFWAEPKEALGGFTCMRR